MSGPSRFEGKAAELREAFDRSFAAPPSQGAEETEDLLLIRGAGASYAVRLRDIAGLVGKRPIVPLPAGAPGLLGLAGIRGDIVPVFGLCSILGHGDDAEPPPWMLICGAVDTLALGFGELEGYLRVPRSALRADEGARGARRPGSEVLTTGEGARPVISVPLVVSAIRDRAGRVPPAMEQ